MQSGPMFRLKWRRGTLVGLMSCRWGYVICMFPSRNWILRVTLFEQTVASSAISTAFCYRKRCSQTEPPIIFINVSFDLKQIGCGYSCCGEGSLHTNFLSQLYELTLQWPHYTTKLFLYPFAFKQRAHGYTRVHMPYLNLSLTATFRSFAASAHGNNGRSDGRAVMRNAASK